MRPRSSWWPRASPLARAMPHVSFHVWRLPGGLTKGARAAAQVNPLTAWGVRPRRAALRQRGPRMNACTEGVRYQSAGVQSLTCTSERRPWARRAAGPATRMGVRPCAQRAARGIPPNLPYPRAQFLQDFKVPAGEFLLSNAANSVLGRELVQMARRHGTRLINAVRRREVVDELRKQGCAGSPNPVEAPGSVEHADAAAAAVRDVAMTGALVLGQRRHCASQRQPRVGAQRRRCRAVGRRRTGLSCNPAPIDDCAARCRQGG
jgi:hypothetical protein